MSDSATELSGKSAANPAAQMRADGRPRGKPFAKGVSPNPGGKSKLGLEELCRIHTPEAVTALVKALANPRERVPAAIALLDRGWGKPAQMITGDSNRPLIVDFRWADNTNVDTASNTVIDAVSEQLAVAWNDEEKSE